MTIARSKLGRLFLVGTLAIAVLVAALFIASTFAGEGAAGQSVGKLEGIRTASGEAAGAGSRIGWSERLRATAGVVAGGWALVALAAALLTRRVRWWWWLPAVMAWWIAFELVVSPLLVRPWNLWTYGIARKVDHRPTNTDGEFNADSLRGTVDSAQFAAGGRNVVFLGDSFTFGAGVEPEQCFVRRFELMWNEAHQERAVRTANFGWVSSSPLLSLRRLRDTGEKYHPSLVVMCFDMTDFSDDLRYGNMLEKRGLYALYDKLPITLKVFRDVWPTAFDGLLSSTLGGMPEARFFASEQPLDETRKWLEVSERYVRDIDEWCRARGVEFVLVVLPRCYQYDEREAPHSFERGEYTTMGPHSLEPFRWFDEMRARERFPIVSLLPDFQAKTAFPTCFDADPHWNATGHDVAARALVRELGRFVR